MSVLNNSLLLGAPAGGGGGGYQIERSLRFNSADSAYLNRTPASLGNRKTFTFAAWVKLCNTNNTQNLLNAGDNTTRGRSIFRYTAQKFDLIASAVGGTTAAGVTTDAVFRDFSAWYHIVWAIDTTQATGTDRVKFWANGVAQQLTFATTPDLDGVFSINHTSAHRIGGAVYTSGQFPDFYLADIHFIDGQALTPSDFGEFDANNVWQPKAYTGSYGTNGFHLDFADNSTAAALGNDAAGSNDWSVNNLSVTGGAGNDSLVDTPTNYGTDTGAGGEVRGNYATLNPLWFYSSSNTGTLSNGNLEYAGPGSAWASRYSTIGVTSGKWYFEASPTTSGPTFMVGIVTAASTDHVGTTGFAYYQNGNKYNYGSVSTYGATYTTGDIIGVAFDLDAGSITFYKNGTSQGTAFTGIASGTYYPGISCYATTGAINFGQRPFAYTAPSGFKALCTANLPAPTVANGATAMDVVTYTGNGSTQTISGLSFSPDLVWMKGRSAATDHAIYDAVRGVQLDLVTNSTAAETTQSTGLTAFNSDGFSLGALAKLNTSSATYAAWAWDAGSSTVTNTAGTITSQVRANASAGFSVITYTGAGAGTIGHGLGVAPGLIIVKKRNAAEDWVVYHSALGASKYLWLNTTGAAQTNTNRFGGTEPTSTVFSVGSSNSVSGSNPFVAYAWAPVAGYSAFGSYVGNGVSDGPFVYTGFRPRFVLVKMTTASNSWLLFDARRPGYNVIGGTLYPDSTSSEATGGQIDFVANGFKLRDWGGGENNSGATHVYAAFAESPFQSARAR